ncbi:TAXI family TRAP transporter solute-binding subunit [Leucobacter luti]|uniref:TRAP transporter TAXI family solute receptor n=1 Tax=Leucobacter luti TaxID=340320 RepID=A0A4Q7TY37_9MICO|nr:TAXI family TRAP transporter solute-binding subunit [Leucobacter luti]MBL3698741.1 TAXI family TRAP transporter solute-binding subunit [Leucobacter luti]RZT66116.1 hypothetical protein EV139_1542 [Leucobacter luti]
MTLTPRAAPSPRIARRSLLLGAAAGALGFAGCAPREPPSPLRMACGEPGGTYVRFGTRLGDALARRGGGRILVQTTDGSASNIARLQRGDADLGMSLSDTAAEHHGSLVALGRVYQNYLQCIVRADRGFTSLTDLVGGRVSIGAPGSGTAFSARRALAALGLATAEAPLELLELRLADAVARLADGSVDAVIWSGGIPVPELEPLTAAGAVTLLDLQLALPQLTRDYGAIYQAADVPSAAYGSAAPLPAIGVANLLLVRPDFQDPHARALVDTLIDDAEELITSPSYGVHFLSPPTLIGTAPIALHPAAQQRYAERYG